MSVRSISEIRDITPTIVPKAMPIDAIKAIAKKVEQLECQYVNSLDENGVSQGLTNLAAVKTVLTGNTPFGIYVFDLTADFAAGAYTFDFVEKARNVETATSL